MGDTLYHRLGSDEIRLIRLPPANLHGTLTIQMIHSHLEWVFDNWPAYRLARKGLGDTKFKAMAVDTYEATSYTWGSPMPTRKIVCNGQGDDMRENAFDFLQQLRLPHTERLLWMDCICINQEDDQEKAVQVEKMHWIYRNAKAVLIWLGHEADESALAMEYIYVCFKT